MARLLSLAQTFLTDIQIPDVHRFNSCKQNCMQDFGTVMGTGALRRACFGETTPLFAPDLY